MVRVGILDWVEAELLAGFPEEAEVVRYSTGSAAPIEVEFLVPPSVQVQATEVLQRARGLRVVPGSVRRRRVAGAAGARRCGPRQRPGRA